MPEFPYMQWFVNDWMSDAAVQRSTLSTRAIWFNMLNVMHQQNRSGNLNGTPEQLARTARCTVPEIQAALKEISLPLNPDDPTSSIGSVTLKNGIVTVVNRRMLREYKARKLAKERQIRHRSKDVEKEEQPLSRDQVAPRAYRYSARDGISSLPEGDARGGISDEEINHETGEVLSPGRFTPPTLPEVVAEGQRIMLPPDECEKFLNHHEARGWVSGRSKIRSWKHALRTWLSNYRSGSFNSPQAGSKPTPKNPFAHLAEKST